MDFFYEKASPMNEFFRNMDEVPYSETIVSDFGVPPEGKERVKSAWEIMLEKANKNKYEHHSAHKSHIWETVCILIRYVKFQKNVPTRCPWQIGDYDYELHQNEIVLLTPTYKFVDKVIRDASHKIGYRSVAYLYTYLSYNNARFTKEFIEAIKFGITNIEAFSLKSQFKCF